MEEREWHIFVHKPSAARPPTQARAIVVELRYVPASDIEPRLVTTFEQLRRGESLEVWGPLGEVERVRAIPEARYPGGYRWEQTEATPERATIAVHPVGRAFWER